MKMSFSLTSLQPSSNSLERRKQVSMPLERPYNSLTKKRKDPKQMQCQRMWTNREDNKDDFWAAIRSNYDYIMDTNLIDSCKEANGELTWDETDVSTQSWSLKEVSCQFSELYSWLRVLQELVYSKEENILNKSLRAAHMAELRRKAYRRKLFNEQAEKLVSCTPALKDEVAWRVNHLNAKWELVEQIMAPVERTVSDEQDVSADFEHEVKCLRKWLREMESRLKPLSLHVDWTLAELEEKAMEHMILQRDIEAHGRIVCSVVKLSERVFKQRQQQSSQSLRVARSLERRWHLLFLRALEWQCHIETLVSRASNKSGVSCQCSSESDEEPVTKQPRLSRSRQSCGSGRESPASATTTTTIPTTTPITNSNTTTTTTTTTATTNTTTKYLRSKQTKRLRSRVRTNSGTNSSRNDFSDSDASSESRSIDEEGSYFEDELCQFCVMDAKYEEAESCSTRISHTSLAIETGDQGEEADVEEERDDMPPTPNTVPMTSSKTTIVRNQQTAEQTKESVPSKETLKRRRSPTPLTSASPIEETASFNTSDRKSKNCAIFYFKHLDTDSEVDCCQTNEESTNMVDDSSEEEWTYTSSRANNYVCTEERKTNVVVRLDFNETPRVSVTEKVRFVETDDRRMADVKENDEIEEERISKRLVKNIEHDEQEEEEGVVEVEVEEEEEGSAIVIAETITDAPEKDSDDDAKSDKASIGRLIKEVEKLVREERQANFPRTFPPLIFEEKKGTTMNHRAKYARIKEWLRMNSTRGHEVARNGLLQSLDSCDASGEYTTEESDGERQSVSSEDLQSSVATYRRFESGALGCAQSQSMSQEIIENLDKTPVNENRPVMMLDSSSSTSKVIMRSRHKSNGPRPWSVSCISQIASSSALNQVNDSISQFSISQSETALHQLVVSPPTKSISLDAAGSPKSFNNSTSTLLEESIICQDGRTARNSSLRRKKSRLRKKHLGRKSGSSSECVSGNHHSAGSDGSLNQQRSPRKTNTNRGVLRPVVSRECYGHSTTLVKSGSFSGCTAHQQLNVETTLAVGDPSSLVLATMPCCRDFVASTDDAEEDQRSCIKACSTYEDSLLDTVLNSKEFCNRQSNVDSDIEMNSLGNNSFSEQAWDNYQEKYMSETYSEAPDVETARRLLEFGDDYRNFLDSQSDCASSSMSALPGSSAVIPRNRMRHEVIDTTEDSDSDIEDIRNVLDKSQSQCVLAENLFVRSNGNLPQDCVEVESACRENLRCLNTLLESISGSFRTEKYMKQVRGAIERWESLASRVEESRMASSLHQELSAMLLEFKASHDRLVAYEIVLEQPHVLDDHINRITAELISLRERKAAMLALNVSAHRLITDLGASTSLIFTALKDGVADLYRVWDETFQRGNQRLCALQTVQQFNVRLSELQCDLRRDKDTLAVLDVALQAGATSEVASSVRHVARLLSEKQEVHSQNETVIMNDATIVEVTACPLAKFTDQSTTLLNQEGGSLSDSGISDSGSEQELSERERRLAALRRLTRSLENQLDPGSEALAQLWKRVEDAEHELRNLQKQCRELIVRTAASVESRTVKRMVGQHHYRTDKRKKASVNDDNNIDDDDDDDDDDDNDDDGDDDDNSVKDQSRMESTYHIDGCGSGGGGGVIGGGGCRTKSEDIGDPENEPGIPHSWIWRILRAALPFQLALVALFCAACLLEPHCCEAANTLNLSLTPQLRYVRGPPPV